MKNNTSSPVLSWLRRLMLLLVVFGGSAQAAVYVGVWDPPYGSPFANLGWRGSAEYFVPDTCEPTGTVDVSNAYACGGLATVTSAQVEFYDIGAPSTTLDTLVFDETSLLVGTLRYVGGTLTQLTTGYSNTMYSENLGSVGVSSAVGFFLQFTLDGPRLGYIDCSCNFEDSEGFRFSTASFEPQCQTGFNDSVNFPPEFTITRVPEPGTLALASLALLGLVPRRFRAALLRPRR